MVERVGLRGGGEIGTYVEIRCAGVIEGGGELAHRADGWSFLNPQKSNLPFVALGVFIIVLLTGDTLLRAD